MTAAELVCVGAVAGAYGVHGEARVKSFTAEPEAIAAYGTLFTEGRERAFDLRLTRPIPGGFAARLSDIATRQEAEALRGTRLYVPHAALPALPDDEFYHADLIGLPVHDTGGALLGVVRAVQNNGADDLLELACDAHAETVLLPFSRAVVPTVDLGAGRIVADPPAGLFD